MRRVPSNNPRLKLPKNIPDQPRRPQRLDERHATPQRKGRPVPLPMDSLAYALVASAELVAAVMQGRSLADLFERRAREAQWPDAVRGAVRDLSAGCLRDYGRGDFVLGRLLHKPLPEAVHAVLLVALHRLNVRPEQAYLIVDQAVEACAWHVPGLRGVANGVLRNAMRQHDALGALIEQDTALRHAHPRWWVDRVSAHYPAQWNAILEASNQRAPMSLRANTRRCDVPTLQARLAQSGIATTRFDNGALLLDRPVSVASLPGFAEGLLSVQDAGAQWAAQWLDLASGQRVLDACAAPGGKACHILELAEVELLALEHDAGRVGRIRDNLARLQLEASVVLGDAARPQDWWDGRPFDRILADVPCSASGVVRRHPDIKWLRRPEDIARFAAQQRRIIDALWPVLAPGGKLLYVTCSIFADENGAQVAAFCERHADAMRVAIDGKLEHQLLPTPNHDGFFYALLQKRA